MCEKCNQARTEGVLIGEDERSLGILGECRSIVYFYNDEEGPELHINSYIDDTDFGYIKVKIDFCPFCGEKLN